MNYEKVSVNVDDKLLAQIDLLVADGFYSTRSDFINQAIESQIAKEGKNIDSLISLHAKNEEIDENQWFIGVVSYSKEYLEQVKRQKKKLHINGFGVLSFSADCSDELIIATVETISRKIKIHGRQVIVDHYKKK